MENKTNEETAQKALTKFLEPKNRAIEEAFARTFSEKDEVHLIFIDDGSAQTDGTKIEVNPAFKDIYKDTECLLQTEELLGIENVFSQNPWAALKMVCRSLTIHEGLHLLYTDFPHHSLFDADINSENEMKCIEEICNIIEDSYIESVGESVYDNVGSFLKFLNISMILAKKRIKSSAQRRFRVIKPKVLKGYKPPKKPTEETAQELSAGLKETMAVLNEEAEAAQEQADVPKELSDAEKELLKQYEHFLLVKEKTQILIDYFEYMGTFLLAPFVPLPEPGAEIAEYVEKTKQLFLDGSIAPTGTERYAYGKKIYEIILPLIPKDKECKLGERILSDIFATHRMPKREDVTDALKKIGKAQSVTTRLFRNLDGSTKSPALRDGEKEFITHLIKEAEREENDIDNFCRKTNFTKIVKGADFKNAFIHNDIRINENHPQIDFSYKSAYQTLFNRYKPNINSYNAKFLEILDSRVSVKDAKHRFGSAIDSKNLCDAKKRFWSRIDTEIQPPDLSVLFLVDGSGSMEGARREVAVKSCVILHEVLKAQNIEHAIIEHRANFTEKEIDINVLVNFNSRDEEKYNILRLNADDNSRDGLAILWAERYIKQKTTSENRLILILSDGYPCHEVDEYVPPASSKDTAEIVRNVIKRGTNIIAVALDESELCSTYEDLKEIYPYLIKCTDLEKLTGQLLRIVSKQLEN